MRVAYIIRGLFTPQLIRFPGAMFKKFLPVWFVSIFGISAVVAMTVMPPSGATQVAVVLPPWQNPQDRINAVYDLEIPIVRHGFDGHVVIVDITDTPDVIDALESLALFLADPVLAGACISLAAGNLTFTETT